VTSTGVVGNRGGRSGGREEVLAAAVRAITNLGYYRASSNAIAREAGVTWGSIQHHFGSREKLMLAVLEDSVDQLVAEIGTTEIVGNDLHARVTCLLGTYLDFFSAPSYIAVLQIIWNLGSDVETRADTRARLIASSERVDGAYRDLAAKVGPQLTGDLVELARKLAWGLGVNLATQTITRDYDAVERKRQHVESLASLADILVAAAEGRRRRPHR
jgi:AcrR family transcriptional regulator